MNSDFPNMNYCDFKIKRLGFKEYFKDTNEEYLKNMPKSSEKFVRTTAFVDVSFGQNNKNRKSHIC